MYTSFTRAVNQLYLLNFSNVFIKEDDYIFIKNLENKIKIMWLSEPIIHHFKYPFKLIQENKIDYVYGCVMDNIKNNRFE